MSRPDPYALWKRLVVLPGGRWIFSRLLGVLAPYTGTIHPKVLDYQPGLVRIRIRERWRLRNPFRSVHAIALSNVGEAASGLAIFSRLRADQRAILLKIESTYLKKARGILVTEGRCSAAAAPETWVEAEIRDSEGAVVCQVRALWAVGDLRPKAE